MPTGRLSLTPKGVTYQEQEMNDLESNGNGRFQVAKVGLQEKDGSEDANDPSANQYTYVYDTRHQKSFGQLTREVLPKADNFRDLMSVHAAYRPTLDELHNSTFHEKPQKNQDEENGPTLKGKIVKFGMFEGVIMRCLLNIWGVMLFLRLSWVTGNAGIMEGFLIITLANIVTFITALSMSAVSTNGQIKGGGIYYMISRSLGPEIGGAIGLMFTIANSIAVSLYIVGFCESLQDLFKAYNWGIIIDGASNDIRTIGCGVLIAILILAFIGMEWVTRTQMFLLFILIAAQFNFMIGSFIGPVSEEERAQGFIGYNLETFKTNFVSDYRKGVLGGEGEGSQQNFVSVLGVFFPAVTGIVAGANLSGDLKDPSKSIPQGTLLSIIITYISYIIYAIMMGGCVLREATGNVDQYMAQFNESLVFSPNYTSYTDCSLEPDGKCKYGLLNDAQVMTLVSSWGPLIYMGCFAATLSSAIASLVGAPRILQALAKDRLYPLIFFFSKGYGANNDPFRGYFLVFFISLGCLLIANLDLIAPLLSNFFLAAYFLINLSVFHSEISKSPGWRPSFRYFNAWISLFGCALCIAVMFLMNWITALVTVAVCSALYMYVWYRKPEVNWGSSTQAQSFNTALKSIQDLNAVEDHVKNYRPKLLVLAGFPSQRPPLIDFASLLVKNISLMICGQVIKEVHNQKVRDALTRHADNWLKKHKKRAFYSLIEDEIFERGCRSMMQLAGLGKLRPNMVLMGYKKNWNSLDTKREEVKEYFNVIHEALDMHISVGILRLQEGLDYSGIIEEEEELTPQQLLEIKKDKGMSRNQSETQFSQDGTSSEASTPPVTPKIDRVDTTPMANKTSSPLAKRKRRISFSTLYSGPGGTSLPRNIKDNVTQFARKQRKSFIDVWWLYDDGGLTLLLPYILTTRSQFSGCNLRIFSLANRKDELGIEQRNMAALLSKFRIDFSELIMIPDIAKKAQESTKKEFDDLIAPFKVEEGEGITDSELMALKEKTNRHLRLKELVHEHSKDSTFIVMTLPMPRKGTVSAYLYLAWLETISKGMPPFLFVRGNQSSVLTFYS